MANEARIYHEIEEIIVKYLFPYYYSFITILFNSNVVIAEYIDKT